MNSTQAAGLDHNAPLRGDDNPAAVTARQAQKCGAIINALVKVPAPSAELVEQARLFAAFLHAVGMEAKFSEGVTHPTAEEYWQQLDDLPWP